MTTRIALAALTTLLLSFSLAACGGTGQQESPKADTPPVDTGGSTGQSDTPPPAGDIQQPDDPNPTGTPVGESKSAQPVDVPQATREVPEGTPMESDQEQALALLNWMETQADAPRWVLTWQGGSGQLDLDATTGILQRLLPDGTVHKYMDISKGVVEEVANGKRGWGG